MVAVVVVVVVVVVVEPTVRPSITGRSMHVIRSHLMTFCMLKMVRMSMTMMLEILECGI